MLLSAPQLCLGADRVGANDVFISEGAPVKRIIVTVNKSRTFNVQRPFARAIVGSVDFADVLPLSDRAIYIQGKRAGTTNVSLFDGESRLIGVVDLEIVLDTANMTEKIRGGTGTQGVRVTSQNNQVVLTGVAADAVAADRAMQVAKSLAGDQPVVNAMQVAPSQQVMLEVRFLEVSRTAGRELGVNWQANVAGKQLINTGLGSAVRQNDTTVRSSNNSSQTSTSTVNGVTTTTTTTTSGDQSNTSSNNALAMPIVSATGTLVGTSLTGPFGTVLANVLNSGGTSIDVLVTALEEKGVVRRLAEPNLIALSGDEARFLAGGEFPVPVAADTTVSSRTVTIEFKKFGVQLKFRPIVLARGVINLKIEPEVSELDFSNAVTIAGTTIPALVKRDAATTVELRDGQSFAIAGLLSSVNSNNLAQIPWLGSVPVLGALFRSAAYQQKETDLVIIVTPRLIGPIVPGQKVATPMDSRLPSNDVDFFLMGQPEVKKEYTDYVGRGGGLKGPYGHMIQPEPPTPPANKR